MPSVKLTKEVIDATLPRENVVILWDNSLKGFGLKVTPTGRKIYICQYRTGGGRRGITKRYTIGQHGSPWTSDTARKKAKQLLGLAANDLDPAKSKQDQRAALNVSELCDLYLAEGCTTKKASTIKTDRGRITRHIKPLLGRKLVPDVSRGDVERFLKDVAAGKTKADLKTGTRGRAIVKGGRGAATRTVGLLGGIFTFAVSRGFRADNPVRGVKRFPDQKNERFLSSAELGALGQLLREMEEEGANASAIAIIRLLAFTGARKNEIVALEWSEVDFEHSCLRLNDSKTGQKVIPLGPPAIEVLSGIERIGPSRYVFPSANGNARFQGVEKVWRKLRARGDFGDLRLHDLRHSYASMGLATGDALPVIGKLLGHADPKTTSRYAHLGDDPLRAAAERISGAVAKAMHGDDAKDTVVPMRGHRQR